MLTMQINKIITIGSLTFDIFVRPLRQEIVRRVSETDIKESICFPFGEKIRVKNVHECFGGGAANTGIGFSRLGIQTSCIGAIGNDEWGQLIINNLKKEKINTDHIQKAKEQTGFSVILNSFEGDRTVLAYSGANHAFEKIEQKILENAEGIHLCHLSGKGKKVFEAIKKHFEKNPQKFLSWNPGKEQLEKGLDYFKSFLPVVDILFLNREEAEELSGLKSKRGSKFGKNIYDLSKIFKKFYQKGFKNILVITDGQRGAQCSDSKSIYFCPIENSKPRVDTLGAGDAFCSGFSSAYIKANDLPICLKYGTINSASVVSEFGAQKGLLKKQKLGTISAFKKLKTEKIILK